MCGFACVMFEERFTLCFKVVGEFSYVEIYVLVFFAYVDPRAWPLFRLRRCPKFFFFLAAPSLISISHIDVAKRYCNEKICTDNIFIQVKTGDPGFT